MASRRLRIKPIANVPVRRGKIDDNVRSVVENGKKEAEASTISVEGDSQGTDVLLSNGSEKNISISAASTLLQSSEGDVMENNDLASVNTQTVPECRKNDLLETNKEMDTSIPVTSKNTASMAGTSHPSNNVPPGLVRKRVKPAVSISAATRRPRDSNNISNSEKTDSTTLTDNSNKIASQESVCSSFRNENMSATFPSHSDMDTDTPSSSGKDIGVGVPGIAQIPTGTAIRPQHDCNIDASTYLDGNGEAPQSLPEPDLPSEGAGIGDNDIMLKSSFSQASSMQKSRFMRPSLDSSMHHQKLGLSGASNSESEDNRKKSHVDINSSPNACGKVLPDRTRAVPHFIASQGRTTDDKSENSIESDEELRESSSELNTYASPVKKSVETSRGRFARPIPRLVEASVRRNSIQNSTSESEEESKKGSYQCSTTSPIKKDIVSEDVSTAANNDTSPEEPEKKIARARRAPSSCMQKMAKARQEFQTKFGNRRPDRSRLTMFDLIFYNPTTNPMKSAEEVNDSSKYSQTKDSTECIIEERLEEEQVDEPAAQEDDQNNGNPVEEEEEEEAMAMPVPQVKVGPDGQIILDEKSLVIETTGAKKNREDLANSAVIVDYGTGSTGYGTYSSKKKKYKEWSKQETLKFYRALNTVGTDFLLMQSIFPNRTRQDLKVKFKKEDRMNRFLVEKALRYPLDFDLTELEKDLEKEQEEERQKKLAKLQFPKRKSQSSAEKKLKKSAKSKKIKKSFLFAAMDPSDTGEVRRVNKRNNDSNEKKKFTAKHPRKTLKVKSEEVINSSSSSDEENELEFNYNDDLRFSTETEAKSKSVEHNSEESDNELDELEYLTKPRKPTRSGRIPQPRKLDEIDDLVESKLEKESNMIVTANNSVPEGHSLPLEDLTNIEPGSLVVLATQSPTNPGHQVYKVFMVAPSSSGLPVGSTMTPVTVPSQILQKLSSSDTAMTPNACNALNNESQSACTSSAECLPSTC